MSSRVPWIAIVLAICWFSVGCGRVPSSSSGKAQSPSRSTPPTRAPSRPRSAPADRSPTVVETEEPVQVPQVETNLPPAERTPLPIQIAGTEDGGPPPVDLDRVKAAGIRALEGEYITLYTDIPAAPAIDELPKVFDLAMVEWCKYFGVEMEKATGWKVIGSVIKDKQRFLQSGLLPEGLPSFSHGYSGEFRVWLYDQPSDYYRRHLLLHEGTHAFMVHFLQGGGPPWFMEGMAELLGTHHWDGNKLTLRYFPQDKTETPYWGRIKIVKDDLAANRGMPLRAIMNYPADAHLKVESYGWSWAAAVFLDSHPEFQEAFRNMIPHSRDTSGDFSLKFARSLEKEWPRLGQQWQHFIYTIEYGHDIRREAIADKPVEPFPAAGATVEIRADRGWQSTGYEISDGTTLQLTASGRYQLAADPKPWICEPDGVTVMYYRGQPLGRLIAAVAQPGEPGLTRLARPQPIGAAATMDCQQGGILYLRINDSPAQLEDNTGQLTVKIALAAAP